MTVSVDETLQALRNVMHVHGPQMTAGEATAVEDAYRLLEGMGRERDYLKGRVEQARVAQEALVNKLCAVTLAVWPNPIRMPDGTIMDGTDEMKVKAHDAIRAIVNRDFASAFPEKAPA